MEKVRHISATTSSSSFRSRLALCGVLVCRYVRVRMPATPVTSGVIVVYFSFLIFSFSFFSFFSLLSRIEREGKIDRERGRERERERERSKS